MKNFAERLKAYRAEKGVSTQTEFAKQLGIARQLYSNLENDYKPPSKKVLDILVNHSNLPEEYWLYGVGDNGYLEQRKELKCLYEALEQLLDTEYLELKDGDWSPEVKELLISALKADVLHIQLKSKNKKKV